MLNHEIAVMTRRAVRAAIAAVIVAVAVTACNGNGVTGPDPAACKAALQAQYVKALAGKAHFETDLPACKGLPESEVQRFAQQVQQGK
jgi:hypothetical protein